MATHNKAYRSVVTVLSTSRLCLTVLTLVFSAFAFSAGTAYAQPVPAPSPCDDDYYSSLQARAWLEAQREITQNQNLIFKPDSVMEYTCFDRFLDELATHATQMFSENLTRWTPPPSGISSTSMDNALQQLVGAALTQYISGNFSHTFLGGRSGLNYTPSSIGTGSYSCDMMDQVWEEAKCWNFIDNTAEDGFYTFTQYDADQDKRFLPTRCTDVGAWTGNINASTGTATPWTEDNVVTFLNELDPAQCGAAAQPIATGIIVTRPKQAPTQYEEKVCVPPGCHYVPTGMSTGNCT